LPKGEGEDCYISVKGGSKMTFKILETRVKKKNKDRRRGQRRKQEGPSRRDLDGKFSKDNQKKGNTM